MKQIKLIALLFVVLLCILSAVTSVTAQTTDEKRFNTMKKIAKQHFSHTFVSTDTTKTFQTADNLYLQVKTKSIQYAGKSFDRGYYKIRLVRRNAKETAKREKNLTAVKEE